MVEEKKEGKIEITRRKFINWLVSITGTATVGSIVYPIIRYLIPPEVSEQGATSVVVGTIDEIPINGYKIFRFGQRPGIIIRLKEREFLAFSAKCTHLDCIVQYRPDYRMIWCACHNGFYDLSGKNVAGPPPKPLEVYKTNILADKVIVSKP
ncbi:MAG: ubiquinol-cytochrome c reductase iron-sulfur subunit [Planctomycetota bacterium]